MKLSTFLTLITFGLYGLYVTRPIPKKKPKRKLGSFSCWLCGDVTKFKLPDHSGKFNGECGYCGLSCDFEYYGETDVIKSVPGEVKIPPELCRNF